MPLAIEEPVRIGRFTPAQMAVILDRLDALEEQSQDKKRRSTPRYPYRYSDLAIRITQPGGTVHDCRVQSRNLSAAGLSILYSGFLYNNTEVAIRLHKRHGSDEVVAGNVMWCRHITGPLHSIGIKFRHRVFPKLYIDPSMLGEAERGERVDPTKMEGSVLMIEDQLMDRLLFEHQVKATRVHVDTVATCDEALQKIAAGGQYDIVLSDLNLAEMRGEEAFRQVRGLGYKGALIAVTAETTPARIMAAQAAGAAAVIRKPYDFELMMSTLAAFLKDGGVSDDQLIYSTLKQSPGFEKVLKQYVDGIKAMGVSLQQSMDAGDLAQVRAKCQTIKGSGAGFGFQPLTDAAREAGRALDATRSLADAAPLVENLIQICRRVSAKPAA